MTAALLTLFQSRQGWTNEERAQFARIERLLEDAGFAVDVEHGLSDEGEPWCVFCARATGDVIIHAACINGRYMFDSSTLPRPIEGASFQRCAERFFEDVSLPVPLMDRRRDVLLHPSALLASLFITVLLYAQVTAEQPLFAETAVDVDGEDGAAPELSPLALRLRAIAQQVAEFVAAPESGSPVQKSGYVNPALGAIPAGMALAVIAIAQDLAVAQALFGEEIERQALPAGPDGAVSERTIVAPPADDQAAAETSEPSDTLVAEAQPQSSDTRGGEFAAMVAALIAAGFDFETIQDRVAAAGEALADALPIDVVFADLFGGGLAALPAPEAEVDASLLAQAADGLDAVFETVFDLVSIAAAERFVIELAGRIVEFDVVRVADGFIDRIELALISGDPVRDTFYLITDLDSVDLALADGAGTGSPNLVGGGSPGVETDAPDGQSGSLPFVPAPPVPVGDKPAKPADPAGDTAALDGPALLTAFYPEAAEQIAAFVDAVGDLKLHVEEDGDAIFWDASVTMHVDSRDIVFETVFLADNTKLLFVGVAWDFDGFDGLV